MGQALVDLSDPMDAPPPTLTGTDDLLAQLAGEEIDRLLAEVDAGRAAFQPPAAAAESTPPSLELSSTGPAALDSDTSAHTARVSVPAPPVTNVAARETLVETAQPAASPTPVTPENSTASGASAASTMDAELDALFSAMNQTGQDATPEPAAPIAATPVAAAAIATPSVAAAPVDTATISSPPDAPKTLMEQVPGVLAQFGADVTAESTAAVASTMNPASAGDATESVMTAAERDALGLANLAAETDVAEQQDAVAAAAVVEATTPARFRIAIRLLEGLNAPLAFIPDAARDVFGRAAIVTLVNSVAVLIYVLFIRH